MNDPAMSSTGEVPSEVVAEPVRALPSDVSVQPISTRRRLWIWGLLVLALVGSVSILYLSRQRSLRDMRWLIGEAAARHGLERELVEAVVHAESSGNARAVSRAQAYGLMQLRVPTASDMAGRPVTQDELFDPRTNLDLGCRYLKTLLRMYHGDERMALMAYNAGMGNLDAWRLEAGSGDPALILESYAFRQTRAYVRKVLATRDDSR